MMESAGMDRRTFLKLSAVVAASAAAASTNTGCSGMKKNPYQTLNASEVLNIDNCRLVDVLSGKVIHDVRIVIAGGKIVYAGLAAHAPVYPGTRVSAENRYVIPGLIDAHCHMTLSSTGSVKLGNLMTLTRQQRRNFEQQLHSGVTTVRDMGAMPPVLHRLMDKVDKGMLAGPRVVYCNAMCNIDGGHPEVDASDLSRLGSIIQSYTGTPALGFENMDDLKTLLAENAANADFIKLTMDEKSLIAGHDKLKTYTSGHLRYMFDYADKTSRPVAAHVMTAEGLHRILDYPVHSVEHLVTDQPVAETDIRRIGDRKIAVIPTCVIGNLYANTDLFETVSVKHYSRFMDNEARIRDVYLESIGSDDVEPEIHMSNMRVLRMMRQFTFDQLLERKCYTPNPYRFFGYFTHARKTLKLLYQAGALIGCGTDAGVPMNYHGTLWREMELLVRMGFTPEDVLRFATINNAKILGIADKAGSLSMGKYADMVLLEANPLNDLETLRKPVAVLKEGKVLYERMDGNLLDTLETA